MLLSVCVFATPSGWAMAEVESAKRAGLVPEALLSDYQSAITREEFSAMAILLYEKLSGKEAPEGTAVFSDTQNADVNSAYALGIVNGMGDGIFAPNALITREEISAMFLRCIKAALPETKIGGALPNTYPDADAVSSWAKDAVRFVNMCEIMIGDENGNINPKNNTTREQAMMMVLRIYNAFKPSGSFFLDMYGFSTSGNSSTNMANGSFAIKSLDGKLFISDNSGITDVTSGVNYTANKASGMYVGTSNIYYIKAADKALYKLSLSDKTETKVSDGVVSFSPAGEYIYIKNSGNELFAFEIDTNKSVSVAKNVNSVPMGAADKVYYGTDEGIFSYSPAKGETAQIYKGVTKNAVNQNTTFYFQNEEGYVCSFTDGKVKVITPSPAKSYCIYSGAIAYVTEDGLYKCDVAGKFNIKMLSDTNISVNSHEKTLFIKSADGKISSLNIYTGEKTALN